MSSADAIKILKAFFLRALLFPKKNAFPISKVTELAAMTQEPWGKIQIISILRSNNIFTGQNASS